MKGYFFIILIVFCGQIFGQNPELELDDGIYIEKPLPKDTTNHKYSKDNISYKVDKRFIYDYYYVDKAGKKFKFLLGEEGTKDNPLNLVPIAEKPFDLINKFEYIIEDAGALLEMPDYTQTVFGITYLRPNGQGKDTMCEKARKKFPKLTCSQEGTGIVDNKMNLWMHPPRSHTFKILQLCPYPFYYLNETIKNWGWTLETGGNYLDPRWIDAKGQSGIKIKYDYIRGDDETIKTLLGNIKCKVTHGKGVCATLPQFKTTLKSYYNPAFGFVRLEYDLVNGDKIVIWLEEMK